MDTIAYLTEQIKAASEAELITVQRGYDVFKHRKSTNSLLIHRTNTHIAATVVELPLLGERLALWPTDDNILEKLTTDHLTYTNHVYLPFASLQPLLERLQDSHIHYHACHDKEHAVYAIQHLNVTFFDALEAGYCRAGIERFLTVENFEGAKSVDPEKLAEWASKDGRAEHVLEHYQSRRKPRVG